MAPIIALLVLSLTVFSPAHPGGHPRTLQSFGVRVNHGQPVYPLPANVALGLFNSDPLLDVACVEGLLLPGSSIVEGNLYAVRVYQNLGNGTFSPVWEKRVTGNVERLEWRTTGNLKASIADPGNWGELVIHYADGRSEPIPHEQMPDRENKLPVGGFATLPPPDPPLNFHEVWRSRRNSLGAKMTQVGDIDNDGRTEAAYLFDDSTLTLFESYGNDQYRLEWDSVMEAGYPFAITDIDNDGHKEIVVEYTIPGAGVIGLLECFGEGQFRFYRSNITFDRPPFKVLQTDVNHDGIRELTVLTSNPSAPIDQTLIYVAQFSGKGPGPNGWMASFSPQYIARYQGYTFDMAVGQVDGQGWDEIIPAGGSFGYHEPAPVDYLWYSGIPGPELWRTRGIYTGLQSGTGAVMFANLDADTTMEFVSGAPGPIGHGSMFALKYQHDTTWSVMWADSSLRNSPLWVNSGWLNGQFVVAGANTWDLSPLDTFYANLNVYKPQGLRVGVWRRDSIYIEQFHLLDIDHDGRTNLLFAQVAPYNHRLVDYESDTIVVGAKPETNLPGQFELWQNYPNPFNPTTTIRFELPTTGDAELLIYDILGRETKTVLREALTAGNHAATWNGRNEKGGEVSSGVYFYRLTVRSSQGLLYTQTKKMLLLR